jgi:DNA-binding beta-propeller fold protein YncE
VLTLASLLTVPAALGAVGHRYAGQFSSAGTAPGDLDGPSGLSVRQSTGGVYVLDVGASTGAPRVQLFDSSGAFQSQWTGGATPAGGLSGPQAIAVDPADGDVFVADTGNGVVVKFDASGSFVCVVNDPGVSGCSATTTAGFSPPSGVAVDPSNGDLYVSDTGNGVVAVFDDGGAFLGQFDGSDNSAGDGPFSGPTGIAVDAAHNVYVVDSGKGRVEKFAGGLLGTATFTANLAVANPVAVATDPATGDVYVGANGASGAEVVHLDSAGEVLYTFGAAGSAASAGSECRRRRAPCTSPTTSTASCSAPRPSSPRT